MLILFFDTRGIVHHEFAPKAKPWTPGSTAMLFAVWGKTFGENDLNWRATGCSMMTMHSPSYRNARVSHYNSIITLPHTSFSTDLALLRFLPLPEDEAAAEGTPLWQFQLDRSSGNRRMFLVRFENRSSQHAFQQWRWRWDRCFAAQGHYFEGNAAQT